MPYEFYKTLHFAGILLVFVSTGALIYHAKLGQGKPHPLRKLAVISHGVGMFFILLAGFGLLARLGMATAMPNWVYAKLVIWAILGGSIILFYKKPNWAGTFWFGTIILGVLAAYLATWKPF